MTTDEQTALEARAQRNQEALDRLRADYFALNHEAFELTQKYDQLYAAADRAVASGQDAVKALAALLQELGWRERHQAR